MEWVIVEQDEGLMVDWTHSEGVEVFFVDYDEASQNEEYRENKLEELEGMKALLPASQVKAIVSSLKGYV